MTAVPPQRRFEDMDRVECPQTGEKLIAMEANGSCYSLGGKFACCYLTASQCPREFSCAKVVFITQLEYVTKRMEDSG